MFRALEDAEGEPLNHNFRPIQDIGDRIVLYSSTDFNDENEIETTTVKQKVIRKPSKKIKNGAQKLKVHTHTYIIILIILGKFIFHIDLN